MLQLKFHFFYKEIHDQHLGLVKDALSVITESSLYGPF